MIGDPSGTSAERNLLDRATLEANLAGIRSQLERFLDFDGPNAAVMVNNLDWLSELSDARVPARRREALHDPVHAREGLRPVAPRGRPVVHRVQLHAPPGGRLPAPLPDARRRAADGRRRPVGQHHGRSRADPPDGDDARRRGRRRGPRPRPRVHAPARPSAARSSARRRRGRPSGSTPSGRRRTRSTSTGWASPTTRWAGCCGSSRCSSGRRSRRWSASRRRRPELRAAQRALALEVTARVHGDAAAPGGGAAVAGGVLGRAVEPVARPISGRRSRALTVVRDRRSGRRARARRRSLRGAASVERRGAPAHRPGRAVRQRPPRRGLRRPAAGAGPRPLLGRPDRQEERPDRGAGRLSLTRRGRGGPRSPRPGRGRARRARRARGRAGRRSRRRGRRGSPSRGVPADSAAASSFAAIRTSDASSVTLRAAASTPPFSRRAV